MKPFPICDKTISPETIKEDILSLEAAAAVTNDYDGVNITREFLQQLHDLMEWYCVEIRICGAPEFDPPCATIYLQAGPDDPADAEFYGVTINPETVNILIQLYRMNRTETFKALMFGDMWVNPLALEEGVKTQPYPHLFPAFETLEGIEEKAEASARGGDFARTRENLQKCQFVTVKLTIETT